MKKIIGVLLTALVISMAFSSAALASADVKQSSYVILKKDSTKMVVSIPGKQLYCTYTTDPNDSTKTYMDITKYNPLTSPKTSVTLHGTYFQIGTSGITLHVSKSDIDYFQSQEQYMITFIGAFLVTKYAPAAAYATAIACVICIAVNTYYHYCQNSDGSLTIYIKYIDMLRYGFANNMTVQIGLKIYTIYHKK